MTVEVAADVSWVDDGDDVLVHHLPSHRFHRLRGPAAEIWRRIAAGDDPAAGPLDADAATGAPTGPGSRGPVSEILAGLAAAGLTRPQP